MSQESAGVLHEVLVDFSTSGIAIDEAHAMLVYAMIVAHKPERIVEFGLGTGALTRVALAGVGYNKTKTSYTIIDSWLDWDFVKPPHAFGFEAVGLNVITCPSQEEYIKTIPDHSYDLTISDANHSAEPHLLPEFLRITRPDGVIFVHDANNETWAKSLSDAVNRHSLVDPFKFHHVFTKNSLPTERNERGTLMIFK